MPGYLRGLLGPGLPYCGIPHSCNSQRFVPWIFTLCAIEYTFLEEISCSPVLQPLGVSLPLAFGSLQGGAVGPFVLAAGQCKSSFVVACVFSCAFQLILVHLLKGDAVTINKVHVKGSSCPESPSRTCLKNNPEFLWYTTSVSIFNSAVLEGRRNTEVSVAQSPATVSGVGDVQRV